MTDSQPGDSWIAIHHINPLIHPGSIHDTLCNVIIYLKMLYDFAGRDLGAAVIPDYNLAASRFADVAITTLEFVAQHWDDIPDHVFMFDLPGSISTPPDKNSTAEYKQKHLTEVRAHLQGMADMCAAQVVLMDKALEGKEVGQ